MLLSKNLNTYSSALLFLKELRLWFFGNEQPESILEHPKRAGFENSKKLKTCDHKWLPPSRCHYWTTGHCLTTFPDIPWKVNRQLEIWNQRPMYFAATIAIHHRAARGGGAFHGGRHFPWGGGTFHVKGLWAQNKGANYPKFCTPPHTWCGGPMWFQLQSG